jgi:hypothetical protein
VPPSIRQPFFVADAANPTAAVYGKAKTFTFTTNPLSYSPLTLDDSCGASGQAIAGADPATGAVKFDYAFAPADPPAACTLTLKGTDIFSRVATGASKPVTVYPDMARAFSYGWEWAGLGFCYPKTGYVPPCAVELAAWFTKLATLKPPTASPRARGRALAGAPKLLPVVLRVDWGDGTSSQHDCAVDAAAVGTQACRALHAYAADASADAFQPKATLLLVGGRAGGAGAGGWPGAWRQLGLDPPRLGSR